MYWPTNIEDFGIEEAEPVEPPTEGVDWTSVRVGKEFLEKHGDRLGRLQTADGFDLARKGNDYLYVWITSIIDLDYECFYLLDVRKCLNSNEKRDYLIVAQLSGGQSEFISQDKPISFMASAEDHRDRLYEGLAWFQEKLKGFWR